MQIPSRNYHSYCKWKQNEGNVSTCEKRLGYSKRMQPGQTVCRQQLQCEQRSRSSSMRDVCAKSNTHFVYAGTCTHRPPPPDAELFSAPWSTPAAANAEPLGVAPQVSGLQSLCGSGCCAPRRRSFLPDFFSRLPRFALAWSSDTCSFLLLLELPPLSTGVSRTSLSRTGLYSHLRLRDFGPARTKLSPSHASPYTSRHWGQ